MENRKIAADETNYIFKPSKRTKIKNALVLTGGGTTQTFYAMGAVACLVDNGQFDFDLISAVSGGSLLLVFIDLCYNEIYNYYKEPDWYNRYVRKSVYALATAKLIPYLVKSLFDFAKVQDYIFSLIPDFNKVITTSENKLISCEYNYIDGNTRTITSDHTDIIDTAKGIKLDYWYLIRVARCALPLCIFNGRPAYDCGNVNNIPVSAMLTKYDITGKIIIVKSASNVIYESYPEKTLSELVTGLIISNADASDTALNDTIDLIITRNKDNIMCSASNNLNKSRDKFHKGMIDYLITDLTMGVRFYNGFFYTNEDAMKICENEGYIQMYYQLKKRKQAKVFRIPNPEVYNRKTKRMWKDWVNNTNVWSEFVNDVAEMQI